MRLTVLFCCTLLGLLSCGRTSDTQVAFSTHTYATPIFEDSGAFERLSPAFPLVEQLFLDFAEANNYPSISFGIVAGGKLVHTFSSGPSNLSIGENASQNTLYRIASMSKSFTAMAILKLRDEGKLALNDPVSKYIPEFKSAGQITSDSPEISIQQLMTMSAGFPEDNPWGDRQLDATDEELLDVLRAGVSFSNAPGIAYEYSNLGYALLGKVIGNVAGEPYQEYIRTHILAPLGMHNTVYEFTEISEESLALGYSWQDDTWELAPYLHDGSYGAMGGMISSIADYSKYIALHLDAWPPRNDPESGPVKRSSIREMHQPWRVNALLSDVTTGGDSPCPAILAYGYGLSWQKDCRGIVRIAHSGGLPGFGSEWRIYPDYGIGIVSFSNRTYGAPSRMNAMALDTLIAIADLKPRTLPASAILEERKAQLVQVLPEWPEDNLEMFADNFFLDESLARRKGKTVDMYGKAGEIREVSELIPVNQLRGSFKVIGTTGTITVFFTLNPQKEAKIQQVSLTFEASSQ
jgi:CubicO group peptidase (beta-lactamase class C family)